MSGLIQDKCPLFWRCQPCKDANCSRCLDEEMLSSVWCLNCFVLDFRCYREDLDVCVECKHGLSINFNGDSALILVWLGMQRVGLRPHLPEPRQLPDVCPRLSRTVHVPHPAPHAGIYTAPSQGGPHCRPSLAVARSTAAPRCSNAFGKEMFGERWMRQL